VDRDESFDSLDFDDEVALNHEIKAVAAFKPNAFVTHGQGLCLSNFRP
jgi:hypothetical protein